MKVNSTTNNNIKSILYAITMLLACNSVSATEATLHIYPPLYKDILENGFLHRVSASVNDVSYYCVEWRAAGETLWSYTYVPPDRYNKEYTSFTLTGLNPNTQYEVRVHGCYGIYEYWGSYGVYVMFQMPEEGTVVGIYVRCGNLDFAYSEHPLLDIIYWNLRERTLFKKEE